MGYPTPQPIDLTWTFTQKRSETLIPSLLKKFKAQAIALYSNYPTVTQADADTIEQLHEAKLQAAFQALVGTKYGTVDQANAAFDLLISQELEAFKTDMAAKAAETQPQPTPTPEPPKAATPEEIENQVNFFRLAAIKIATNPPYGFAPDKATALTEIHVISLRPKLIAAPQSEWQSITDKELQAFIIDVKEVGVGTVGSPIHIQDPVARQQAIAWGVGIYKGELSRLRPGVDFTTRANADIIATGQGRLEYTISQILNGTFQSEAHLRGTIVVAAENQATLIAMQLK